MEELRAYLNSLTQEGQESYAKKCGTTRGYLRKALSTRPKFDAVLCAKLDNESGGAVTRESLRPDVDWGYLRGTKKAA